MSEPGPRNLITDVPGICSSARRRTGRHHWHDRRAVPRRRRSPRSMCAAARPAAARPSCSIRRRAGPAGRCDRAVGRVGLWARCGRRGDGVACRRWGAALRCAMCACRSSRRRSCSISRFRGARHGRAAALSPARARGAGACGGRISRLGNAGAGLGAKAGRLKGGIGSASLRLGDGAMVGALVAVNSWGCGGAAGLRAALGGRAGACRRDRAAAGACLPTPLDPRISPPARRCAGEPGANTTIAVVATDAPLDRSGCRRLAIMAQDGLARAIRPAHTPFDGDTVFRAGDRRSEPGRRQVDPARLRRLGSAAADCLARAVMRAIDRRRSAGRSPELASALGRTSRRRLKAACGACGSTHKAPLDVGGSPACRPGDRRPLLSLGAGPWRGVAGDHQADRAFPVLRERRDRPSGFLSDGEQQMLTIARTLTGDPKLLLLDEPSEGLASLVVDALREDRLVECAGPDASGQTILFRHSPRKRDPMGNCPASALGSRFRGNDEPDLVGAQFGGGAGMTNENDRSTQNCFWPTDR